MAIFSHFPLAIVAINSHNVAMFNHRLAKELVAKSILKESAIAKGCRIKERTLKRYLNGEGSPSQAVVLNLSRILEVRESELWNSSQTEAA